MSISKKYIAGVQIFSGRPNPEWVPGFPKVNRIIELYETLELISGKYDEQSILGYSGCYIKSTDDNFILKVFMGKASLISESRLEIKNDPGRKLEIEIIRTAPKGLLPDGIIGFDYR